MQVTRTALFTITSAFAHDFLAGYRYRRFVQWVVQPAHLEKRHARQHSGSCPAGPALASTPGRISRTDHSSNSPDWTRGLGCQRPRLEDRRPGTGRFGSLRAAVDPRWR